MIIIELYRIFFFFYLSKIVQYINTVSEIVKPGPESTSSPLSTVPLFDIYPYITVVNCNYRWLVYCCLLDVRTARGGRGPPVFRKILSRSLRIADDGNDSQCKIELYLQQLLPVIS